MAHGEGTNIKDDETAVGGAAELESANRRHAAVLRHVVLTTVLVAAYNPVYVLLGLWAFWIWSTILVGLCLISLGFVLARRDSAGYGILITTCIVGVFGFSWLFGSDTNFHVACLFAALICPFLFRSSERKTLVATSTLAIAGFVAFEILRRNMDIPTALEPALRRNIEASCLAGIAFIVYLTLTRTTGELESVNRKLVRQAQSLRTRGRELRQRKEEEEAILRSLPDVFLRLESSGRIARVRGRLDPIWVRRIEGRYLRDLLGEAEASEMLAALSSPSQSRKAREFVVTWRRYGFSFRFEVRLSRFGRDEHAAIVRDVTSRERSEKILREQQLRLFDAAKMATLGEMAGNIAHEINNPLTVIIGAADILRKKVEAGQNAPEQLIPLTDKVVDTGRRIARIVSGMRLIARDGQDDPIAPVSLRSVVEETLALCEQKLKNRCVVLELALGPEDAGVMSRAVQLSQVLLNLLSNAADAMENVPEGKARLLRLEVDVVGPRTIVSVLDNGPGVPAELRERIFTPFFTTKEVGKGTGLGLSIAKGMIESQGGRLYYDALRSWTCFSVELESARCDGTPGHGQLQGEGTGAGARAAKAS